MNLSDQSILNAETKKSLNDLANSSVDKIDFNKFFDEVGISTIIWLLYSTAFPILFDNM